MSKHAKPLRMAGRLFFLVLLALVSGMFTGCQDTECASRLQVNGSPIFLNGINYPWKVYGGDFGGIKRWKKTGIATNYQTYDREFALIKNTGSRVVRWWMFPDLRGDGIRIEDGQVQAGPTLMNDVQAALKLAEKHDLYLVLCLFSFEAFAPERTDGGIRIRNLEDILADANLRESLLKNVIGPLARAIEQSPYGNRLLAFDLINEPEWALKGKNPYGDPVYYPLDSVRPVSHEFMEAFLLDLSYAIREHGSARITVGQAAPRWPRAWKKLNLDFYQWHIYSWMEEKAIYREAAPTELCAPIVFGEAPVGPLISGDERPTSSDAESERSGPGLSHREDGLPGSHTVPELSTNPAVSFQSMVQTMERNGWAGIWVWSFQRPVPDGANLDILKPTFVP